MPKNKLYIQLNGCAICSNIWTTTQNEITVYIDCYSITNVCDLQIIFCFHIAHFILKSHIVFYVMDFSTQIQVLLSARLPDMVETTSPFYNRSA